MTVYPKPGWDLGTSALRESPAPLVLHSITDVYLQTCFYCIVVFQKAAMPRDPLIELVGKPSSGKSATLNRYANPKRIPQYHLSSDQEYFMPYRCQLQSRQVRGAYDHKHIADW